MAQSVQIQKVGWWHERLADIMIANPHATLGEIATALGKSQAWISIVKNSDVFVDYWRQRSGAHSSEVTNGIKAKGFAAAELALEHIHQRLEEPSAALLPIDTLLNVVDVNMKRFGYDSEAQRAPVLNINLGGVTPEQLAEARQRLRAGDARRGAIEAEALPVPAQIRASDGDPARPGIGGPPGETPADGPEIGPTRDLPNREIPE